MNKLLFRMTATLTFAIVALVLTSGSKSQDDEGVSPQAEYYQVSLQLAELEHRAAAERNRRLPGIYANRHMERLDMNVKLAKAQLENAKRKDVQDMSTLHALHAKEWAEITARDFRVAAEVAKRDPTAISPYQLEKARLTAEIARLRVELWKEPESLSSLVDHLHWEIDRMGRDILDLQQRLEDRE